MSVLGVIPARGGSKRIPHKNIKPLCGKPLIEYTINAAINSDLDAVLVSTDDPDILLFCESLGINVIERPVDYGSDDAPTILALQHAIGGLEDTFDAVITLQPTSPFRQSKHINAALKLFTNEPCDSLVSVQKIPHNFCFEKTMNINNERVILDDNLKRSQDTSVRYARNGAGIYISNISLIMQGRILGDNILPFEMNKIESLDIDDLEDWVIAEALMNFLELNN